jgi:uncharacterized pyridoxamine 5'-phosphate oxidase family protein
MKFALVALLGAVSAFDNVELPRYAIESSPYCKNLLASTANDITNSMRSLPNT